MNGGDRLEEMLKAVGNLGFPIVVSAYLLIRVEAKLDRVISAWERLAIVKGCPMNEEDAGK